MIYQGICSSFLVLGTMSSGNAGWTSGVKSQTRELGLVKISAKVTRVDLNSHSLKAILIFRSRRKGRLLDSWELLIFLCQL